MENAEYGQLSIRIDNKDSNGSVVENVIYTTKNADENDLTVVIGATINTTFMPGKIVRMEKASDGTGSLLYLDLTSLELKDDEFRNLIFECKGWIFGDSDEDGQIKCMTPESENVDLNKDESINISIKGMALTQPPSLENVDLMLTYYRVKDIATKTTPKNTSFTVHLQVPPKGNEDLHEYLNVEVDPNCIISNNKNGYEPLINKISLIFSKGKKPSPINAVEGTTVFKVAFTYADRSPGYGALTTVDYAGKIDIKMGISSRKWTINKVEQSEKPLWLLEPRTGPILDNDTGSTVEILIENIYTEFQPGPTLMMVSYSGLDGFKDGAYWIRLKKIPHVSIEKLSVDPNPARFIQSKSGSEPTAEVTISWKVLDAGSVELKPFDDIFASNEGSIVKQLDGTTQITLQAKGLEGADRGNVAVKHEEAKVMPVINSLIAEPTAVYCKDFPRDIKLCWNVDNQKGIKLHSSHSGYDSIRYDPIGSIAKEINEPQMFTLLPRGDEDNLLLRKRIVISAFKINANEIGIDNPPGFVVSSPNAGFIAATIPSKDQLIILDSLGYNKMEKIADPIGIGTGKEPLGLAFSPDGSRIFVANSGDGTVSVIQVSPTGSVPSFSLTPAGSIKVGGIPQQLAVSPNGKYIYVTVEDIAKDSSEGLLVILEDNGNGEFSKSSLTIGPNPRGVAVSPSGAQIFAASSGDDAVYIIGCSSLGGHYYNGKISNLQSKPNGLAVTSDGKSLLVACSEGNKVYGISTEFPASARRPFDVGGSPEQIAIAPGGRYAFVTNSQDGTVSLIGYGMNADESRVLEKSIKVGKTPHGIAVSSEGGLVFVANHEESSLTVLNLSQYDDKTELIAMGDLITDIAVSPDGRKVLVWHNSLMKTMASQKNPSKGFFVYEEDSKTVTQLLKDEDVVKCAFSPLPEESKAFITFKDKGDITIYDFNTKQFNRLGVLPSESSVEELHPSDIALSADGSRLFAIYKGKEQYRLSILERKNSSYSLLDTLDLFEHKSKSTLISLCASPDGSKAFILSSLDNHLWIVYEKEIRSYTKKPEPIRMGGYPGAIAIAPDGSRAYVLNTSDNSISVINTDNYQVNTSEFHVQRRFVCINDIAVAPDGTRIFATDGMSSGMRVIGAAAIRFIQSVFQGSEVIGPYGIAVMPDGSRILTANVDSGNMSIFSQVQPSRE